MDAGARTQLFIEPYPSVTPEAGLWLGGLQRIRQALLRTVERIDAGGLGQEFIDWRGVNGDDNSVGSLLYHVAGVELGWLYTDLLMQEFPPYVHELFPYPDRDAKGALQHVPGVALSEHVARLNASRARFLEVVGGLDPAAWRRMSEPAGEEYAVTPEWIVWHLIEHEAGHLYAIRGSVRKWLAQSSSGTNATASR